MNYLDHVNTKIGTASCFSYSNGNISPLTALPFASASFMLETRTDGEFLYYHPFDRVTTGIRLTHKLSPWLGDHGNITILPTAGHNVYFSEKRRSGFRPSSTVMSPAYLSAEFLRYRSKIELAPSMRGCIGSMEWLENDRPRRVVLSLGSRISEVTVDYETNTVTGCIYGQRAVKEYFIIEFDAPLDASLTVAGNKKDELLPASEDSYNTEKLCIAIGISQSAPLRIGFRLITSFISIEQARLNMARELDGESISSLRKKAEDEWNAHLSKIEIDCDIDTKKTFYSCLWRAFLYPHTYHELDANEKAVHANPVSGEIFDGPLYTDTCLWDTFRTTFPLLSILLRERYAEICEGFLNFYRECGWLPRIIMPYPGDCMPGTAIDGIFADAVAKGVVTDEKTIRDMLDGMLKHANITNDNPNLGGRDGIADYKKYHYVPLKYRESVNKTQDYAYGDFCIAVIAKKLGLWALAEEYIERSKYYASLYDSETKLMKPRDTDGSFRTPWSEFNWGVDYTEGSAWQNSFFVPHDMQGLASLMGGKQELIAMIDKLFATPPYYNCGEDTTYPTEIHEMTEMAAVDFGQCALSNQPSFHIPFIYSEMGEPDKTCYWVRRAVRELFSAEVDGLPGDEDTGSMGAWYVFSALGFYPFCPSKDEYVLASPTVKNAKLHLENGKCFEITAHGQSEDNVYVKDVLENGKPLYGTHITQDFIMSGGKLEFMLTNAPTEIKYS